MGLIVSDVTQGDFGQSNAMHVSRMQCEIQCKPVPITGAIISGGTHEVIGRPSRPVAPVLPHRPVVQQQPLINSMHMQPLRPGGGILSGVVVAPPARRVHGGAPAPVLQGNGGYHTGQTYSNIQHPGSMPGRVVHSRKSQQRKRGQIITCESGHALKQYIRSKNVVFVDFMGQFCQPCKELLPVYTRLAEKFGGDAAFVKVDVSKVKEVAKEYGIASIPTFKVFVAGREVYSVLSPSKEELKKMVMKYAYKQG